MKTKQILATAAISALMLIGTLSANAQGENRAKEYASKPLICDQKIPGLTDEQKTKMKELRVAHLKEITPLKNLLEEKQARLNTLTSAEKTDMAEINKTIDEISKLKADMMKARVNHQMKVKALLTDEQKVFFNAHMGKKKGMMHRGEGMGDGMGEGKHRGEGKGMHKGEGKGMHRGQHMGAMECEKADTTK